MIVSCYEGSDLKRAETVAREALELLIVEASKIAAVTKAEMGKATPVKPCNATGQWHSNIMYYDNTVYTGYGPSWKRAAERARQAVAKMRQEIEATHSGNLVALESNKKARAYLKGIMEQLGFPEEYSTYEYKTARSRNKTQVKHTAGWLEDCYRWLRTDDNYDREVKALAELEKQIEKFVAEHERQDAAEAQKAEAEQAAELKRRQLVLLISKYGLPLNSEAGDVLDVILRQNKYLRLAHYLQANRNDWTEGHDLANIGLNGFVIEATQDQAIYDDITNCIINWDGDGRVFRDTEWGYDRLFALVEDTGLLNDYQTVTGLIEVASTRKGMWNVT